MKAVAVYIQLGSVSLKLCHSFTIESSWDTHTDTANIEVPNVLFKSETSNTAIGLDALLQRGDPVEIRAGYNKGKKQLQSLFKGYISDIVTGTMLKISAQDAMYALKQASLEPIVLKATTLGALIAHITKNVKLSVKYNTIPESTGIGDWAIENNAFINPVQVLQKLKGNFGFVSYIKDGVLNVGVPYDTTGTTHYLLKELNFAGEDNLNNEVNDTFRILKGVSIKPDNSRIIKYVYKENEEIKVSDTELFGELRTLNYYNLTENELIYILKTIYQTVNWSGFEGSFTTFGEPIIRFNDWIKLRDLHDPERNGTYKVKKVTYQLDVSGGLRQGVTIDYGISEVQKNS